MALVLQPGQGEAKGGFLLFRRQVGSVLVNELFGPTVLSLHDSRRNDIPVSKTGEAAILEQQSVFQSLFIKVQGFQAEIRLPFVDAPGAVIDGQQVQAPGFGGRKQLAL